MCSVSRPPLQKVSNNSGCRPNTLQATPTPRRISNANRTAAVRGAAGALPLRTPVVSLLSRAAVAARKGPLLFNVRLGVAHLHDASVVRAASGEAYWDTSQWSAEGFTSFLLGSSLPRTPSSPPYACAPCSSAPRHNALLHLQFLRRPRGLPRATRHIGLPDFLASHTVGVHPLGGHAERATGIHTGWRFNGTSSLRRSGRCGLGDRHACLHPRPATSGNGLLTLLG